MEKSDRVYIAIDLKSFYASVEAVDRGLDPLSVNLVVADESRTEKTICLAVSPSLKEYGIPGRARLFEVVQKVKDVNRERLSRAVNMGLLSKNDEGGYSFTGSSYDAPSLKADPSLEVSYIVAVPRMKLYEEISTKIFNIYSEYVSTEDIQVYSIDEVFMDVTAYLETYNMTPRELTVKMIREVLKRTGITATAGIGTNLYLAKIAMDIVAKHVPADEQGVRIAELDERSYRELLWCHRPLTDFWRVGKGIAKKMEALGCHTMGDIALLSEKNEDLIYNALGINAELLIDHAWGWEPADIKTIKSYRPQATSLSSGQVLSVPYDWEKAKLIVREMTELLVLDLVRKDVVTRQITLTVNYDRSSLVRSDKSSKKGSGRGGTDYIVAKTGKRFTGQASTDYYGRPCPKHAHGTGNLDHYTSSTRVIVDAMMELYDRIVDKDLYVRRLNVVAVNLIRATEIPPDEPKQLSLFEDFDTQAKEKEQQKMAEEREHRLQIATLKLQEKYGKNAVLKGMNLLEGATTIERNRQIGGHRAGENEEA
ncbi:MAG: DNA methylase [Lachnospiraceae bacterium]|nr:DNA methylase [Lachnospiraceae bacterium]